MPKTPLEIEVFKGPDATLPLDPAPCGRVEVELDGGAYNRLAAREIPHDIAHLIVGAAGGRRVAAVRVAQAHVNGGWVGVGFEPGGGTNVVSMSVCDIEVTFVGAGAVWTRSLIARRSPFARSARRPLPCHAPPAGAWRGA